MAVKTKAASADVSFDPEDAEQGGFLDGVNGTIESAECVLNDYNGNVDPPVPAIKLIIMPEGADEAMDTHLSAGNPKKITPSKDGQRFVAAKGSKSKGLNSSSNAMLFIASLKEAGFPIKKLIEDGIGILEGVVAHFVQVPQPKRNNVADDEEDGGRQRTVLNVSGIVSLPWEKGGKKKKKAAPVEDEDEEEDDDEEEEDEDEDSTEESDDDDDSDDDDAASDEAKKAITALLKKSPKGIPLEDLATGVFAAVKKSPNKKAIVELVQDEDWLSENFTVKGDKLTK